MKLTKKDKAYLKSINSPEEDFEQIELAMDCTTYELEEYVAGAEYRGEPIRKKNITRLGAVRLLGRETWLNGLDRSAFHYTAVREVGDGRRLVVFDSRELFRD